MGEEATNAIESLPLSVTMDSAISPPQPQKVKETEKADPPPNDVGQDHSIISPPYHSLTASAAQNPAAEKDPENSIERDFVLARVETEKRLALIRAWERSEKTKSENKAYKQLSGVGLWEDRKKASVEAQIKKIEEKLERKKGEYVEKMKNKMAEIHQSAEEKRAMTEAQKKEEFLKIEDTAAKYRSRGCNPRKFLACFRA